MNTISPTALLSKVTTFLSAMFLVSTCAHAAIDIDQQPLLVTKPVPGNMAIIGSFEFPTMVTRAHKQGDYNAGTTYAGYFDSKKYYQYKFDTDEKKRHFFPVRFKTSAKQSDDWDGNFLNWATMQSIDIFRQVLTGGHRFLDESNETWLEKGVQTGQGSDTNFPVGTISDGSTVNKLTPVKWGGGIYSEGMKTRIGTSGKRMGNIMRFARTASTGNDLTQKGTDYNPDIHGLGKSPSGKDRSFSGSTVYEVSIRVKVCVKNLLEDNCEEQSSGHYKPTGLIQQYADEMRFSAFGYLNDNSEHSENRNRKGGIMHARMKYVGPTALSKENIKIDNTHKEWDPTTGVFYPNPDTADAAATPQRAESPISHSGVISYINLSGHLVDGTEFKRFDNVSELYYTAYRYLKGMENIAAYTNTSDKTGTNLDKLVGGLPVISNWKKEDPIQFSCQKNFFVGIGDTNTHNDRKFVDDGSDDLIFSGTQNTFTKLRTAIHAREGMNDTSVGGSGVKAGSDYIAVLAYDANTNDLRPNMPGKQTASTYWIDILESGLKGRQSNAYWLTAKYGGLKVPANFDPTKSTPPLLDSLWRTTNDKLSTGDYRPDNFYVVDKAQDMIDGLTKAFASIQLEQRGSRASLALNSTKLTQGSSAFQTQYASGTWTGNLFAYDIDATTGALSTAPKWNAESQLPAWGKRNVYVNKSKELKLFKEKGKDLDGFNQDRAEYLLGNRAKETDGTFRTRQGLLGDIVNSQPVFVGNPKVDLFNGKSFTGADKYREWAQSIKRTPMVYVGANDGMLHGFNADTGVEVFAFIPETVIKNGLSEIADKNYMHRYFLDGEITVADTYINGNWKTILVGTLGAGGVKKDRKETNNAVFALDITNPENIKFIWEKNTDDLGINIGKPVIIQDQSDANPWKVVLGNGPNSDDDNAILISIALHDGDDETVEVSKIKNNGLSAFRAWSSKGDGITDTLYAGDMQGNLWKFTNITDDDHIAKKIFTAKDSSGKAQPITTAPLVGISPHDGSTWIFFGTGQYLNTADLTNKDVQSWYGIKDTNTAITRGQLVQRKILGEVKVSENDNTIARIIDEGNRGEMLNKAGWYIDLVVDGESANGERMVTPNQFQGGALIGNTRIPDASDPCAPSGTGRLMAIDPFTGGSLSNSFFDINGNGKVMFNGTLHVISGIGFATGISNPAFLSGKMYISTDNASLSDANTSGGNGGDDTGIKTPKRTSWRELINLGN